MADENIGSVKISEEVIAGIASTAACEVEGVTRLSSKGVAAAKELVTEYKQIAKGVYAAAAPGVVNFCVGIVVENGVKVQEVSSAFLLAEAFCSSHKRRPFLPAKPPSLVR